MRLVAVSVVLGHHEDRDMAGGADKGQRGEHRSAGFRVSFQAMPTTRFSGGGVGSVARGAMTTGLPVPISAAPSARNPGPIRVSAPPRSCRRRARHWASQSASTPISLAHSAVTPLSAGASAAGITLWVKNKCDETLPSRASRPPPCVPAQGVLSAGTTGKASGAGEY